MHIHINTGNMCIYVHVYVFFVHVIKCLNEFMQFITNNWQFIIHTVRNETQMLPNKKPICSFVCTTTFVSYFFAFLLCYVRPFALNVPKGNGRK